MSVIWDLEPGEDPCNFEMIAKLQINTELFCQSVKKKWVGGLSSTSVPFEAAMPDS